MEKGLGDLGFWIGLGIVIAAMIVSGALKERDKEREKQATLRALLERDRALMGREGQGITEILAYLREKDAAEAARADAKRLGAKGETRGAFAFAAGILSFVFGFITLVTKPPPAMRLPFPLPGYVPPPPVPESNSHLVVGLGIWAAGVIIVALILCWERSRQKE